ncbi:potassium transporter Kup [Jatrophihabitans sp. YIM 134969]
MVGLAVGALGVVFGDIGTSPLYALKTVFSIDDGAVRATPDDVYGVISLVFWSITIVVSIKYVAFILRADNDGEGGIMALAALVRRGENVDPQTGRVKRSRAKLVGISMFLGVLGASLFYGDSIITPAISVLSAVEGIEVTAPDLADVVLPIGIAVLVVLFVVQRFGTHQVGRLFGPVMIVWFVALAVTGIPHIVDGPGILRGLSPTYALLFVTDHLYIAFIAMGAVVLVITGAEALYADMGHFGRPPIRRAWFFLVFPALTLNYLGQGALILDDPSAVSNPFYLMLPSWAQIPMVVLATLATLIASQAVISGAFSVSRQAVRLGFLPLITVKHTSEREMGQIYVPVVNWLLFGGVTILIVAFQSSDKLATAYGLAVTGTLILTTTLFLVVAATQWGWKVWQLTILAVVFGGLELTFFAANLTKVVHGGWLPLVVAIIVVTVMTTWQRGRRIITKRRKDLEGSLQEFVDHLNLEPCSRVPGTAVFPHPTKETTPLALRENFDFNHVLHEKVVIVSVLPQNVPHVPVEERITVDNLDHLDDGIVHVAMRFGFQDDQDIPAMLRRASGTAPELDLDVDNAYYFLSRISVQEGDDHSMPRWRKRLFVGLAHNATNPAEYFMLPDDRTVVMGAHVDL